MASRPRLVVAYMQARVPAKRAKSVLRRQRRTINSFRREFCIPIDVWYQRAKGVSPVPTIEDLIASGQVYALIVSSWEKLRGWDGHWPELWKLCQEYRVRKVCIAEQQDFCARGERNIFLDGYWDWPNNYNKLLG